MNQDLILIQIGMDWLTRFKQYQDDPDNNFKKAVVYGNTYARLITRIRSYLEQDEIDKEYLRRFISESDYDEELKDTLIRRFFSSVPIEQRLARIEELFIKLKAGNDWILSHQDDSEGIESLIKRAQPIIEELEGLGVTEVFSIALLIMGAKIDFSLVEQFKGETDGQSN